MTAGTVCFTRCSDTLDWGSRPAAVSPKFFRDGTASTGDARWLYEKEAPFDQTLLELRMLDLFPEKIVNALRQSLGRKFDRLPELERLILASAATEQVITHRRITEISTDHAHDLTLAFQHLMKEGLLESHGRGRGTVYHLPGQSLPSADQAFSQSVVISIADKGTSDTSLGYNDDRLGHNERHPLGWLAIEGLSKPLIDNLNLVSDDIENTLMSQAEKARAQKRPEQKRDDPDRAHALF